MSIEKQTGYQPLCKDFEKMDATAPPPAYEQPQPPLQATTHQSPQITVSPNVHVSSGMPIFPVPVGPASMEMTCPSCRCRVKTKVRHRSTAKTHIACLLLSWTFCCCCLPYCMDSCRNANHFCPMCGTFVGTYQS